MRHLLFATILTLLPSLLVAEVKLPSILGSNMVLQRNTEVTLWGTADAGKTVSITTSWNGKKYKVKTDTDGAWSLKVPTCEAGGPYSITFSDGKELVIDNILLGEVWVCGGQSNMEMPVAGFMNQPVEGCMQAVLDAENYPGIRMFTVPRNSSDEPVYDCKAQWQCSTPASVSAFSATGYFFGLTLYKTLRIPIGLVTSNWGGTNIEAWMSKKSIDAIEGLDMERIAKWKGESSKPAGLFNGMIFPIANFTAKGFIWYQGCSNRINWYDYKDLQVGLIKTLEKDVG